MQGIETREVIKDINKEQAKSGLKPGGVPQAAIMSPQPANFSKVGQGYRVIADALDLAANYADKRSKEQAESDHEKNEVMRGQGKAYKDAKDAGRTTGGGWKVADVQIAATDLLNQQRAAIKENLYQLNPEQAREHFANYSKELDTLVKDVGDSSPITQKAIKETKLSMLQTLAKEQAAAHIEWNHTKTLQSISKLMNAVLTSGDPDALQQIKEYMQPGAFNVDPKDATKVINDWVNEKADSAKTVDDEAVLYEINAAWNASNNLPPETNWKVSKKATLNPPGLSENSDTSPADKETLDQAIEQVADSLPDSLPNALQDETSGVNPKLTKSMQKAQERVARSVAINTAVQTGDFSGLAGEKENKEAFTNLGLKVQDEISRTTDIPVGTPEFSDVFYSRYTKALAGTTEVDKGLSGMLGAKLTLASDVGNKEAAVFAAKMLKNLNDAGGETLVSKYLDSETQGLGFRILGYIHAGTDLEDAVMRAVEVGKSKDPIKFDPTVVDKKVDAVLRQHTLGFWELVQETFYDTFSSAWSGSYLPTKDELSAPSVGKLVYSAAVAELAKQFMPDTRDHTGATLRAIGVLKPRTAVIGNTPILREDRKSWEEAINNTDPNKPIPPGVLERDRTLLNKVVMQRLEARSAVFGKSSTFLGKVLNLDEYSTFSGQYNNAITFYRGVPDYRNLHIDVAPGGDGVIIRLKKERTDPTDDSIFFKDTFTDLSTEYVTITGNEMRLGIRSELGLDK